MFYRRDGVVKSLAVSQIFILLLSIFSFAFVVYESSGVNAQQEGKEGYSEDRKGFGSDEPSAPSKTPVRDVPKVDTPLKSGAETPKDFEGPFGIPGGLGYLAQGLSTALLVVGGIQLVGGLLGLDDNQQEALSTAAGS